MDNPYQSPEVPLDLPRDESAGSRPSSVTVFGVLNLVFGILGFLCAPVGIASLYIPMAQPAGPAAQANPMLPLLQDPTYRAGILIFSAIGMLFALAMAVSGVGLLNLRSWGRSLANAYAAGNIALTIALQVFNGLVVYARLIRTAQAANNPAATGAAVGGVIGGIFGSFIGVAYAILLLVFLNRDSVIRAFEQAERRRESS